MRSSCRVLQAEKVWRRSQKVWGEIMRPAGMRKPLCNKTRTYFLTHVPGTLSSYHHPLPPEPIRPNPRLTSPIPVSSPAAQTLP